MLHCHVQFPLVGSEILELLGRMQTEGPSPVSIPAVKPLPYPLGGLVILQLGVDLQHRVRSVA